VDVMVDAGEVNDDGFYPSRVLAFWWLVVTSDDDDR
jgi:hypothetical protein